MNVGLITSGAYCGPEIVAEFGKIPPSFLPFQQQRLFIQQASLLNRWCDQIFVSIPESFAIPVTDGELLNAFGIEVIRVPEDQDLAASVKHCLAKIDPRGGLYILHGDTLVSGIENFSLDCVAMGLRQGNYDWGKLEPGSQPESERLVLAGLFSFSSPDAFLEILCDQSPGSNSEGSGGFVDSVEHYGRKNGVEKICVSDWLDFGHLQNLYKSRQRGASTRVFNSLNFTKRIVQKSGDNLQKISAEGEWFEKLPPDLRIFTPAFLGRDDTGYRLAFEPNPTLQDLFIFGDLPESSWFDIADSCFEFLTACSKYGPEANDTNFASLTELSAEKTRERLDRNGLFSAEQLKIPWRYNGKLMPSVSQILEESNELLVFGGPISGVLHGDFCFSNIHYDFRQKLVKVIDPRGDEKRDQPLVLGDIRYDLGKLLHSLQGYDQIICDRYRLSLPSDFEIEFDLLDQPNLSRAERAFSSFSLDGRNLRDPTIQAVTIQLFLSMVPLHNDKPHRQHAFIANAFRLYMEMTN